MQRVLPRFPLGRDLHLSLCVLLLTQPWQHATAAFHYPNPQISQLEHILVDTGGAYASNFSSAITPCTQYVTETGDAALTSGRTTAAQWLRVAFHDFVTADVRARTGADAETETETGVGRRIGRGVERRIGGGIGTGGIDASIGFETARAENKGSAFNDSFTFWRPFVNEFVSSTYVLNLIIMNYKKGKGREGNLVQDYILKIMKICLIIYISGFIFPFLIPFSLSFSFSFISYARTK